MYDDIEDFADNLATELTNFINSLPSPSRLVEMAEEFIKEQLLGATDRRRLDPSDPFQNGLCLSPSCKGWHVNSGKEENIVPTRREGGGPVTRGDKLNELRDNELRDSLNGDDDDGDPGPPVTRQNDDGHKADGGKAVPRIKDVEILASQHTAPTQNSVRTPKTSHTPETFRSPCIVLLPTPRTHTVSATLVSRPAHVRSNVAGPYQFVRLLQGVRRSARWIRHNGRN